MGNYQILFGTKVTDLTFPMKINWMFSRAISEPTRLKSIFYDHQLQNLV